MWLPLAQYTKNSWPSATTKKTPFDLLIRYTPQIHQPTRKTNVPSLEQRLSAINEARSAAQEAQHKVQDSWVKDKPRFMPFAISSKVWLEATNLKLPSNLTPKLAPMLRSNGLKGRCVQYVVSGKLQVQGDTRK